MREKLIGCAIPLLLGLGFVAPAAASVRLGTGIGGSSKASRHVCGAKQLTQFRCRPGKDGSGR